MFASSFMKSCDLSIAKNISFLNRAGSDRVLPKYMHNFEKFFKRKKDDDDDDEGKSRKRLRKMSSVFSYEFIWWMQKLCGSNKRF